ncbi:hypothetical protein MTO96_006695 [Rhipicephalus appendiculatus]
MNGSRPRPEQRLQQKRRRARGATASCHNYVPTPATGPLLSRRLDRARDPRPGAPARLLPRLGAPDTQEQGAWCGPGVVRYRVLRRPRVVPCDSLPLRVCPIQAVASSSVSEY